MEEKVAPWMPSRPVRPPTIRIESSGRAALRHLSGGGFPGYRRRPAGCRVALVEETAPLTVGMPMRLP